MSASFRSTAGRGRSTAGRRRAAAERGELSAEGVPRSGSRRRRFSRRYHVRRGSDYRRIYRGGSRARGPSFTVVVLPNGLPHSRLGLSVGKRCWKRAVRRNRVRRIFREAFRLSLDELPAGLDVIMIASVPRLEPELAAIRAELAALVARAAGRLSGSSGSSGSSAPDEARGQRPERG